MSTYRSPSRTRHAQEQNHMAETKEEEVSNGCWLQKLKPWIADFPLKWVPSYLSPRHPPIPSSHDLSPLPPHHMPCSTLHRLAGWLLGSCVEVGVVPAVSFCVERLGPSRSQVHSHTSKWSWDEGLQIPKMFQHWFPSPNFPPYTFGWKTEGLYISSPSPSSTWVADVNTLSRFLWSLQSQGQSSPTSSTQLGWLPSGDQGQSVCHQDQWDEERITLTEQKLCALFCLLPCLLVCLLIYETCVYYITEKSTPISPQNLSSWPHTAQWIIPLWSDRKQRGGISLPVPRHLHLRQILNQKWVRDLVRL